MKKLLLGLALFASAPSFANDSIFFCIEANTKLEAIQKMNVGFATAPHFTVNSLKKIGLVMKKKDVASKSQISFIEDPRTEGFSHNAVACVTINGKLSKVKTDGSAMPEKPPF